MRRLVLIDGTNFFFKGMYASGMDLTYDGHSVKCLYSFFQNLGKLVRDFEKDADCDFVICWDGGHYERTRISEDAVKAGIIPKAYKQERREAREAGGQETEDFIWQLQKAGEFVAHTRIGQCRIKGEEADDLVGSYCRKYKDRYSDTVIVTTDKDYYQLLWDGVRIFNSTKDCFRDKGFLKSEYNLDNADQWVDVGALAGESGASSDTIYGVPGIGYVTAAKMIAEYGTLQHIRDAAMREFGGRIGDIGLDAFSGEVKQGLFKPKKFYKEAKVLAYSDVLDVAWKLKKMHTGLDVSMPAPSPDWEKLEADFNSVGFHTGGINYDTMLVKK